MSDILAFWPALLVAAGWVLREIVGAAIKGAAARAGAIGYRCTGCGFFAFMKLENGTEVEGRLLDPKQHFPTALGFDLLIRGDLYNDTDTAVLLLNPRLRFVHPTRDEFIYGNPDLRVAGRTVATVSVPAHGSVPIELAARVPASVLESEYAHVLPLIQLSTPTGREFEFRASATSFFGTPLAVWPGQGNLPHFLEASRPLPPPPGGARVP